MSASAVACENLFARAFPTPVFLSPPTAGVDISDTSVKWLAIKQEKTGLAVASYGEENLPEGIVVRGIIQDMAGLVRALAAIRPRIGTIAVHAALPEEAAYIFSMPVPYGTSREQTMRMIEFEFDGRVPISAAAAVYDFDVIDSHGKDGSEEISVTVFPRDVAHSYAAAFDAAGFMLLSLEAEASSIGRAVSSGDPDEPVTLVADFGRARTGFAVLKRGIPIFTSTVDIGGDSITSAVEKALGATGDTVEVFKNEQGLAALSSPPVGSDRKGGETAPVKEKAAEAVIGTASALAGEVLRHYNYWDTRRDEHGERVTPVGRVLLVGGSSNLRGLPGYIAGRIQAPVALGNIWQRMAPFDDVIPPIDSRHALEYATALGLALRGLIR